MHRRAFCRTLGTAAATGALACSGCFDLGSASAPQDAGPADASGAGTPDLAASSLDLAQPDLRTLHDFAAGPADLIRPPDVAMLNGTCPQIAGDTGQTAAQFTVGTAYYVPQDQVYICRDAGGLYCLDGRCTHAGCVVEYTAGRFACPCHNSEFTYNGVVTAGPAFTPLPHYALCLTANMSVAYNLQDAVTAKVRYNF